MANLGLAEDAPARRDYLYDLRDCMAITGHVGCVGPVALPLAELAFLLGDTMQADELLAHAMEIAQRGHGQPSILRCRLLAARMHPGMPGYERTLVEIEAQARELGVESVAQTARDLLGNQ